MIRFTVETMRPEEKRIPAHELQPGDEFWLRYGPGSWSTVSRIEEAGYPDGALRLLLNGENELFVARDSEQIVRRIGSDA